MRTAYFLDVGLLYIFRDNQQLFCAHLHRHEDLFVELLVVVVAEMRTDKSQVALTDDEVLTGLQTLSETLVLIELTGILQCLVVAEESTGNHSVESVILVYLYLEVTHQEVGEVVFCHLKQQLVLVHGVGFVDEHEEELLVALCTERVADCRIFGERDVAHSPYIADVELTAVKSATFLHTTDNHTCQRTDFAVWIFLNHFLQTFHAAVAITCV